MPRIKARVIDKNRYTKKYPLVRHAKRLTFQGDTDFEIEILSVVFNNEDAKSFTFESSYPDLKFRILLSPRDTTANDSAQVTLAIDDDWTSIRASRILASAPFTGIVDVIIIRIT